MLIVSPHQVCRVSGRGYREFQDERYWFWPTRGIYGNQVGGRTRLLHLEIYRALHGEPDGRFKPRPIDGDIENTDPANWAAPRAVRSRLHNVQEMDGVRYYKKPSGYFKSDHESGGVFMHRAVWERANGPIPDGHHVHHRNHDRSDNRLENLELLSASAHSLHHAQSNEWVGSRGNVEQLRTVGALAKEWHRSDAGRAWHSENAKRAWEKREWFTAECQQCGKPFETPYPTRAKFCHPNCRAAALRQRRRDGL